MHCATMTRMDVRVIGKLAAALALPQCAGALGALFTAPAIPSWYASLARPPIAPPNWIFAPVWTTLFLLMGVALFLVWRKGLRERHVRVALALFCIQLGFNVLWSVIFFGLHRPDAAFVEILLLWLAITATTVAFARISRIAAWLLVPYLCWVSFAAYLNYSIWILN